MFVLDQRLAELNSAEPGERRDGRQPAAVDLRAFQTQESELCATT